jgi:leucyl-tRNA synthetase
VFGPQRCNSAHKPAPYDVEVLWSRLGHEESVTYEPFPVADPAYLVEDTVTAIVQIRGKLRAEPEVPPAISAEELQALALTDPVVKRFLGDRGVRRVIVKPPSLVNIVPA